MIDSVEELFEIEIDHDVVALDDIMLRLSHCLMCGAPRSKAVTVLGKRRVPPLLENLQHSLLNQPVDDARNAELSDPAVRLGDFDPFGRLRLIGSLKQLSPNVSPVLTQVILGGVDGHSIDARRVRCVRSSCELAPRRSQHVAAVAAARNRAARLRNTRILFHDVANTVGHRGGGQGGLQRGVALDQHIAHLAVAGLDDQSASTCRRASGR